MATARMKRTVLPRKRPGDAAGLPFETKALRDNLAAFLKTPLLERGKRRVQPPQTIGSCKWGIYAFFDYDDEPIYVGQTNESLGARIGRHLTNQRSDAVAMAVLDPFEVCAIQVWPMPAWQSTTPKSDSGAFATTKRQLDALERRVYIKLLRGSKFKAVLNEKVPPHIKVPVKVPRSFKQRIVSDAVSDLRDHPDLRIARRVRTMARLAQVISERKVTKQLRTVLVIQAKRLLWLAERRAASAADVSDEEAD